MTINKTNIKKMQIIGTEIVAFDANSFNKILNSMKCIVESVQTHARIRSRYSAEILKQDVKIISQIINELEV
jgi:hypothetical protein